MEEYEQQAFGELQAWKKKMDRKPGMLTRMSKNTQNKVNSYIPESIHTVITESIKGMVKAVLSGSQYVSKEKNVMLLSLRQKEDWVHETVSFYRKTAVVEGVGTGAAGIFIGLADFPLLLSIKMKMLFEMARLYGFDPGRYEERLFILHIFHLAFSSDENKKETLRIIEEWGEAGSRDIDWRIMQQDYRDYIDVAKMLQLVPGFGAAVGAYVNRQLIEVLSETAINCYRIRLLE